MTELQSIVISIILSFASPAWGHLESGLFDALWHDRAIVVLGELLPQGSCTRKTIANLTLTVDTMLYVDHSVYCKLLNYTLL